MTKVLKHSSGTIEFTKSGNAFLISESKQIKKDIFIPREKTGKALNGDSVFVKLSLKKDDSGEYIGEVFGIVKRFRTEFVGIIEYIPSKDFYLVKSFSKKMPVEFYIPKENLGTAQVGDKVVIKLSRWNATHKRPIGVIKQVFGKAGDHSTEMNSILFENNIDSTFPTGVLNDAAKINSEISQEEIDKREDLRGVMTIGIDPLDSRDADDTIGIKIVEDGCLIYINIADVSYYIKKNSAIDKESIKRSTSVYLVDRCLPMLPEKLSNTICSLKSGSDKLCFSAIFKINELGDVISERFGRTIINVNKDYSYEEAQEVIDNVARIEFMEADLAVLELNKYAKLLRSKRIDSSISFEKREVKFKLDIDGAPIGIYFKEQRDSNQLIEEFMLLANKYVAKFLKSKNIPSINRIHEKPSQEKLETLKSFVLTLGYNIDVSDENKIKSVLNKLLLDIKGTLEENIISSLVIRTQSKAIYSAENLSHFGLGFEDYCHFTSPIRRMADILSHRQLASALGNNGYIIK